MPKCGCSGQTCGCSVVNGSGTQVTGTGTSADPFKVAVDASSLNLATNVKAVNSNSMELTKTGSFSNADPLVLSGAVVLRSPDNTRWLPSISNTGGMSFSNGTTTVPVGGSGGTYTDEQARDAAAALFTAGSHSGITFAYDDAGDRINATVTATGSGGAASTPGVYTVDSYGAKGDGVTDDIVAIRAAITALPAGGVLYFTPGKTYLVSDTVSIVNKLQITVQAYGATITCTATGDSSAVMRLTSCTHVQVLGGNLAHKTAGARKNDADGLSIFHCANALVMAVRVGMVYSIGIRVAGSRRVTIAACVVNGSIADGIGVYGAFRQGTNDASISAGSSTLTAPSLNFSSGDVGATISLDGAGAGGATLVTTIAAYISSSQVTLATAASTAVTNYYLKVARPSLDVTATGNHLQSCGDDAMSSVGYKTYSSVAIGPNRGTIFTGNTIEDGNARGVVFVGVFQGVVSSNVIHTTKQGGIYISTEPNVGGSWGCNDILVSENTVENANTDYGNGDSNYASIGVNSTNSTNPIDGISIVNNIIRGGKSYYLLVGGDNGSNTPDSTLNVTVSGNRCSGGNANNPGVQVIKSTNVVVSGNWIDKARTSAIRAYSIAGVVAVRDNIITAQDQASSGSATLDLAAGILKLNNIVNGAFVS